MNPQVFYAAEIDVYQPASGTQTFDLPSGTHPGGVLSMLPSLLASSDTLRASDLGYRSLAADSIGLQVYPPVLDTAFEIDRHVSLEPGQASTATFGALRLSNLGRRYDGYVLTRNVDSRAVKLLRGAKAFDASRGIFVDPAYSTLASFFGGTAASWQLSEEELEIPLRDATYWATRPLQSSFYTGAGSYGGGSDLTGKPIPITRGGTSSYPVLNVPLTLVDSVNLIYQYTDGPGTVVTLYEGGAAVFTSDGNTTNLYAGTPPVSGHYRTDNSRGLVQMGARPYGSRALTADVTGAFPSAGTITTAAALARYVLTETMAQPSTMLATASFTAADAAYPYVSGFSVGTSPVAGLDIVQLLLGSIGARLISARSGALSVFVLRTIPAGTTPSAALTPANVVNVTPAALPSTLDPPPYRWRVGYGLNNLVQTGELNGAITSARQTTLSNTYSYATWAGTGVLTAYRRPNDPAPVSTALLVAADAQSLANAFGAQWQGLPGLYAVEVPIDNAVSLDIGSVVTLTWPLRGLSAALGQIVGEQVRSQDATVTFTVLTS